MAGLFLSFRCFAVLAGALAHAWMACQAKSLHPDITGFQAIIPGKRPFGQPGEISSKPEGRSPTINAFHADFASHQLHKLLGDGKSQSGSAKLAGCGVVHLGKWRKENMQPIRGNANASIADRKPECHIVLMVMVLMIYLDVDIYPAFDGEFHCIGEEVDQNLAQFSLVSGEMQGDIRFHER